MFCYHNTQFCKTCLHGKTPGVRIIVAPTVLCDFFRMASSVSVDLMAMSDMEDASPKRIASATTDAKETSSKCVEDVGHSQSLEQVTLFLFGFLENRYRCE